jgi:hypothetical protein
MNRPLRFSLIGASCLAILAVLAPSALAAGPYYASPTGTGSTCTQPAPCSLNEAVSKANGSPGNVVIGPGAYALIGSLFISQAIDIGGQAGAPAPVIQSTPANSISVFSAHLHDVHIEGSGEVSLSSAVADRIFVSYTGTGPNHTACLLNSGTTLRSSVCWAHDGASANSALRGVFFSGVTVPPVTLRNDTLITTAPAAAALQLEVGSSGTKASIEGSNVIARSVNHADVEAIVTSGPATATIALNHSNYGTVSQVGTGATVTAPGASSNQTAFPSFVGPATGDFREAAASATIDAGIASVLEDTVDLAGNPRSQGLCVGGPPIPDIGAYEFVSIPCPGPTPAAPSNKFKLGKLKLNKKKGTATLSVTVPGAGTLTLSGKGVKKASLSSKGAGTLKLHVKASGKAKKGLDKTGKAKLKLKLTFVPSGGVAATQSEKVKLVKTLP